MQAVVCYRLDRISCYVGDFAKLKDEFDYYNVEFTSIRDNFDTTSPSGRSMMMVSVFAQLERETTAERIRDNMHELAKSGRWLDLSSHHISFAFRAGKRSLLFPECSKMALVLENQR